MNKKIAVLAIVIYTMLNLYVFGSFVFHSGWNYELLTSNNGAIVFGLLVSIFLNTALIIYYSKKYGN